MRRWLLVLGAGLLVLLALVGLAGSALPRAHTAASRLVLAAPAESVWAVTRDIAALPGWWSDVTRVEAMPNPDGGEHWKEEAGGFTMVLRAETLEPGRRFRTVIENGRETGFEGTWTYELVPAATGTELRLTEQGSVANPFFRVLARLGGHHATIDSYLAALARRLGSTATPEHLARVP